MRMDKGIKLIHRLLDGEVPVEEREEILKRINSDPLLRSELESLRDTVSVLEECERETVPNSFTSEVMKRLSVHKVSDRKRLRDFFFRERVFRWNVATAVATVVLVIIVLAGILQFQKRHPLVSYQESVESTVTVSFNFYAPQAKTVSIAGDFNRWSVDDGLMKRQPDGLWTIDIKLKPGTYNYMFVVDGEMWVTDPDAGLYRDDGFGYKNSVVRVRGS